MNFFAELKRRHIYRVAAAYAVVAWLLLQIVNNVAPVLDLPPWVARAFLLALIVGFPITVLIAWMRELAPADGTTAQATTGRLDWALIGALVAVLAFLSYQQFAPTRATITTAPQAGVAAAREAAASPRGAISIAVLPFANLSGDAGQEFFSDGMTEEITSALAKVPDLRVVARTSAYEFKGKNINIKTMGEQLGATHLIEGSVRKAGDRLRITAQLINAADGTHVWAQDYDRQLTDVFAIQEDIARAITASLHMSLGLKPGENLVNNRSIDTESHEKYLRARALLYGRGGVTTEDEIRNLTEATSLLEGVVAKNAAYAPAWYVLGGAYGVLASRHTDPGFHANIADARTAAEELRNKGEASLNKAIQLDPELADPFAVLGWFMRSRARPIEAEELIQKSLMLDPLSSNTLFTAGMFYSSVGRIKEALAFYEKGHAVDPFYPNLADETAQQRWLTGQDDAAIALAKTLRTSDRAAQLAVIYTSMGRYGEAADALMELAAGDANSGAARAARLLRMGPQKPGVQAELPTLPAGTATLYLYLGVPERALQPYERRVEARFINANRGVVWHPAYAEVRKTERFKTLMMRAGLVDYWRAKGWPEFCHPTTGDDFECN